MERTDAQEPSGIAPPTRGVGVGGVPVAPELPSLAVASAVTSGPENDHKAANGADDRFKFDLDYVDPRGFRWTGEFKGRVLNLNDKARVGLTKARLAGGVSYNLLDPGTLSLLEMLAHLAVAIELAPSWWKPGEHRDGGLLAAVYEEVARRELMFWEPPPKATRSEAGG